MSLKQKYASQVALVVKNPPANAGDTGDTGLIPGSGRSPGEGNGHPLQCRCLGNSTDRGVWQVTVHGVAEVDTTQRLTLSLSNLKLVWVMIWLSIVFWV